MKPKPITIMSKDRHPLPATGSMPQQRRDKAPGFHRSLAQRGTQVGPNPKFMMLVGSFALLLWG